MTTQTKNTLIFDDELCYLELTLFVCDQIKRDAMTPQQKQEFSMLLEMANEQIKHTIEFLNNTSKGAH